MTSISSATPIQQNLPSKSMLIQPRSSESRNTTSRRQTSRGKTEKILENRRKKEFKENSQISKNSEEEKFQ